MASRLDIRLGLQIPNFTYEGVADVDLFDAVADQAVAAEEAGFDSVYVMDHFYQLPMLGQPQDPMLECYSLLAALATRTQRVKLGGMVGGVTYRNPAMLAKTVTTLDVISKGRAIWAIGAAWFELEHDAYGYEFGTFTDRFEKLEEALQIVTSMFRNDTTTFDGKWFHTKDALNVPRPVTEGGPPVLIGGSGPTKTLRMVAQYADCCNVFGSPDEVKGSMATLDEHCERLGRDPSEICRTRLTSLSIADTHEEAGAKIARRFGAESFDDLPADMQEIAAGIVTFGSPDEIGEKVQGFLDAGLDGIVINMFDAQDIEPIHQAAEAMLPVINAHHQK